MYSPNVISRQRAKLEAAYGREIREHTVAEVAEWVDRLAQAADEKGKPIRALTAEESDFIENELLMVKIGFEYWASRYCWINVGSSIKRMFPLLESQAFVLSRLADLELARFDQPRADGVLANVLKAARQVGVSTLTEALLAHRITTQNNVHGLIASDVPSSSAYLFGMMEGMIDNLPWWLKPEITERVKDAEIKTDGGSHLWVASGKSTRGTTGQRGQLGRGKTIAVCHLSEISTWDTPEQIDSALLPTLPRDPRSLAIMESTAKGRGNWWHEHWKLCRSGKGRFASIFIPWYVEKKYSIPAPEDWSPSPSTLIHAKQCWETSKVWAGRSMDPSRDQLYWYESTRDYYEGKGELRTFLEEFASINDEECFQHSGYSIFSTEVLQATRETARPLVNSLRVLPARQIEGVP